MGRIERYSGDRGPAAHDLSRVYRSAEKRKRGASIAEEQICEQALTLLAQR
jgi:hypothetical protein